MTKKEYGENLEQNIKGLVERLNFTKICYIVDADIKGFFDHMKHEWQQRVVRVYDPDFHMIELNKHIP